MEGDGDRKRWRTKEMGTGRDEDLEGWRPRGTGTGRDGDARATWRVPRVSDCTSWAGTRYAVSPSGARTEPGTSAHLGLQPHPSAAQVPPRSPPDSGLGFRILRSLRRGAPWVFPERHPAAPAPPRTPREPPGCLRVVTSLGAGPGAQVERGSERGDPGLQRALGRGQVPHSLWNLLAPKSRYHYKLGSF